MVDNCSPGAGGAVLTFIREKPAREAHKAFDFERFVQQVKNSTTELAGGHMLPINTANKNQNQKHQIRVSRTEAKHIEMQSIEVN